MSRTETLPIDRSLQAGIDVGGTKVHIVDTENSTVHKYSTPDAQDMYEVLDSYFSQRDAMPNVISVTMAGPRDSETGAIKMTNSHWPAFDPREASERYPGVNFFTTNDMTATTAGILEESGVNLQQLKPGTPKARGTVLAVTLSTGIGSGAAVWDRLSGRYVIVPSEGGHNSFQPKTEDEVGYLQHVAAQHPHASAENALSGKYGIDNLISYYLKHDQAPDLAKSIAAAREEDRPVGAVLLAYALEGKGKDQAAAEAILKRYGSMVGSAIRDLAVTFVASGGVYLTGSVALAMGEYFAEHTDMSGRFIHEGAVHDNWLKDTPIYLVTDPHVAVKGALSLARQNRTATILKH